MSASPTGGTPPARSTAARPAVSSQAATTVDPVAPVTSPPSTLTIPVDRSLAGIAVVKSSSTPVVTTVGQRVSYTFRLVNIGGWILTRVAVTDRPSSPARDARPRPVTCAAVTLAPGESTTCTAVHRVTQSDLDNGGLTGTATAVGTAMGGTTRVVSAPSTLTIPRADATGRIDVVNSSATTEIVRAGQRVPVSYLAVNTGGVTLAGVTVTDPRLSPADQAVRPARCGPDDVASGSVTLDPGESIECRSTYTVSSADLARKALRAVVTATATPVPGQPPAATVATPVPGGTPASEPAGGAVPNRYASLALSGSASPSRVVRAGERISYRFRLTNTGRETLTGVTVIDIPVGPADPAGLGPLTCGPDGVRNGMVTLTASASVSCQASYRVSYADAQHGLVTNTATATGKPRGGSVAVSSRATIVVRVGELPVTGGSGVRRPAGPLVLGGLAALLSGVVLVLVARRRTAGA